MCPVADVHARQLHNTISTFQLINSHKANKQSKQIPVNCCVTNWHAICVQTQHLLCKENTNLSVSINICSASQVLEPSLQHTKQNRLAKRSLARVDESETVHTLPFNFAVPIRNMLALFHWRTSWKLFSKPIEQVIKMFSP